MNSAEEKRLLRGQFVARREALASPEKAEAAVRNFLGYFSGKESFFVYCSFRSEVDTDALIRALLKKDKPVCVPKLVGKEMIAVPFSEDTIFNSFGISEPIADEDTSCEVAVVPLLAADKAGNRLGYGGGYYDRYFARHPNVLRVGLCYGGQVVEALPCERTDMPLHALVTEDGVRLFR